MEDTSALQQRVDYRSGARVLLLGQGADEQCGGYGRHRTTFRAAEAAVTGRVKSLNP
jgi:asparagine synthetase B (glutamine-hydrolysing)